MHAMTKKPKRLYQELASQIETDLLNNDLINTGDKLPSERELSDKYAVSRTTLREALIMLELYGLIEVRKGSGVFYVGRNNKNNHFQPSISVGPFELLQARQWFESSMAELAATNISNSQLKELKELIILGPSGDKVDKGIHILIAEGTHNNMMIKTAHDLWNARETDMWDKMFVRISDLESAKRNWHQDHLKILHALMRRDPQQARDAMWLHLENVKTSLFEASDVDDPEFDGFLFAQNN